ncbi:MAG: PHP domain-containing protein [Elusimicrobia bacterium]|nr:PHP domain-containing protein [Elusimicrobiota bacterium]
MNDLFIDLHVHTNFSDGNFTPQEAVKHAQKIGLGAIAITDHDITDGITPAVIEGARRGVEVIPGIELSVDLKDSSVGEMHILGYYIDWQNPAFQEKLKIFRKTRKERAETILAKLSQLNINLNRDKIFDKSNEDKAIGRLHIANRMIEEGYVKNTKEAFLQYLAFNRPAYVSKHHMEPQEAIELIKKVKGIPVLAHPNYGNLTDKQFIKDLISYGLCGIEAWHSKHSPSVQQKFMDLAVEFNLLITGGSDCHGPTLTNLPIMGKQNIPYDALVYLKKTKFKIDNGSV